MRCQLSLVAEELSRSIDHACRPENRPGKLLRGVQQEVEVIGEASKLIRLFTVLRFETS
jgi:hypothetical protein